MRADVEMINSFMDEPVLLDKVWLLKEINSKQMSEPCFSK